MRKLKTDNMERLDVFDCSNVLIASYFTDDRGCAHENREHTLIYLCSGELEIEERGKKTVLHPGDCAFMRRDNRMWLQKKVEDGEVIYGLKEYTFDLYMQYEISMYKEIYCNDTDRKGMDLTEEEVAEYYSQGEWVFQDDGEKADLETARSAVERELREKKYDAMIAQMTEDLEVSGDLEAVDRFTLDHLKR